ncbi:hypothetical protein [Paenibacillus agri]|uniref:Uncharacterized protein n=1 Tax=Paenibacillus agri TaxID=2744309 RepID=A0A850ECR3_9BACL|nr:hypothetical protein [Paenibacillus agri]NUU59023.1 hypothetical protein [Paenibacillus agri]
MPEVRLPPALRHLNARAVGIGEVASPLGKRGLAAFWFGFYLVWNLFGLLLFGLLFDGLRFAAGNGQQPNVLRLVNHSAR